MASFHDTGVTGGDLFLQAGGALSGGEAWGGSDAMQGEHLSVLDSFLGDSSDTVTTHVVFSGGGGGCFASGTLIRTARGEIAVEDLEVGDLATASAKARPITWIGHRQIERPSREHWPVRVMAGAFGASRPERDLYLSVGHAVCVSVMDEVFVPVGQLINGATIAQVEVPHVTYWHVELESHDVLLAEGLPCESYLEAGNRAWFGRQYGRLAEIDPARAAASCARPFVDLGPIVHAIRERLAARAESLGWTTADTDLHLLADGKRIEPETDGDLARFVFPAEATEARVISRTFVAGGDRRTLGIRINGLRVMNRAIPLSELPGAHPEEAAAGCPWRWTTGDLALPPALWANCKGQAILTLDHSPGQAWTPPAELSAAA